MDIKHFKTKLEEEKSKLENELSKIAKPDTQDPEDWKTERSDLNVMTTDRNEMADVFEEAENKESIEFELEERLNKIKSALKRIKEGTYGVCKDGCKIEKERLEANPAAETCINHSKTTQ